MNDDIDLEMRFWTKVDRKNGPIHPELGRCWVWTDGIRPDGYSQFRFRGDYKVSHRVAYELVVGPIPEGLQLDHLCRVRHCVNPRHLEPVTGPENVRRGMIARAELKRTGYPAPLEVVRGG